jgi:hypothetical protein
VAERRATCGSSCASLSARPRRLRSVLPGLKVGHWTVDTSNTMT